MVNPFDLMRLFWGATSSSPSCPHTYFWTLFGPVVIHKACGLVVVEGKLGLLLRQSKKTPENQWYEPFGGKPDFRHANPYAIVKREVFEEGGVGVSVGECVVIAPHDLYPERNVAYFRCYAPKDAQFHNKEPDDHLSLEWFSPLALAAEIEKGTRIVLPECIINGFTKTGKIVAPEAGFHNPFGELGRLFLPSNPLIISRVYGS